VALAALDALLADVPPAWTAAALAAPAPASAAAAAAAEDTALALLLPRLGWRRPGGRPVRLQDLTVREATAWQLEATVAPRRAQLHAAFAAAAGCPAPPAAAAARVRSTLRRLWAIQWEDRVKEPLWRLALDGFQMPGNSHLRRLRPQRCACGAFGVPVAADPAAAAVPCPRAHHFWACPVAAAVRAELQPFAGGTPLTRAHLWLAVAPPGWAQCAWDVVVLAAVAAMDAGRRAGLRTGRPAGAPGTAREAACRRAVTQLWAALLDFTELGLPQRRRRAWRALGPAHPVLRCSADGSALVLVAGPLAAAAAQAAATDPAEIVLDVE
jgi:hypothetical protein